MPRAGLSRERVVEEAASVADQVGFDRLTMAAVAERFGVALPSLHKHVGGIDALRRDLAVHGMAVLADTLRARRDATWHPLVLMGSEIPFPFHTRPSTILLPGYAALAEIHPLNDSNVLFYDALIPGSTLLGYANADHWAIALPVARSSPLLGATVVSQNHYPREVLWQAMIDFIAADLESARQDPAE